MSSLTYEPKTKCPKCNAITFTFGSVEIVEASRKWIEFCKRCGWFYFVKRPCGEAAFRLQVYGVDASDEELEIINKILKYAEEKTEGNWRELGEKK